MKEKDVLFSIIVPVYNVEKYIHKCVDSILEQTYKDFECILVDDGSTDGSSRIIDEYEKKDSRVKVIHKENGGESSARNSGLDVARGAWITYIDSDDYIEKHALEVLNEYVNKYSNDALDIISFEYEVDYPSGSREAHYVNKEGYYGLKNRYQAIADALTDCSFACCKLYRTELATAIRFHENIHWGPDTIYVLEVEDCAKGILNISDVLYHYVQSVGSAARSGLTKKQLTVLNYTDWVLDFISKKYPDHIALAQDIYINTRVNVYYKMSISDVEMKDRNLMKKMYDEMHKMLPKIKKEKILTKKKRIKYRFFDMNPEKYCKFFSFLVDRLPSEKYDMYRTRRL